MDLGARASPISQAPATAAAVATVNSADADRSATPATVELPAWLETSCQQLTERLPGEPGAGKSTLLAGLALSMAERDPDYGPFAQALTPNRLANRLEGLRRRLSGLSVSVLGSLTALPALLLWIIGIFVFGGPVTQLFLALLWLVAGWFLLGRGESRVPGRRGFHYFPVGFGLALLMLS